MMATTTRADLAGTSERAKQLAAGYDRASTQQRDSCGRESFLRIAEIVTNLF